MALLEIDTLQVHFATRDGVVRAVDGLSFAIGAGETLALVGESGCGKSVTSMSILRLVKEPPGRIAGTIRFDGRDLLRLPEAEMRRLRGNDISMVFQEPMTSLNPVLTVGFQIGETLRLHQGLGRRAAEARAVEMLELVGIPAPARRVREYPHQLSGGMRQRVMIAMALACNPRLLIADEPTTALDVTIQAQILDLMRDLKTRLGSAILLITHDLGVVAEMAQRIVVMYAGRKVEEAAVRDLFARPLHPYTRGLLGAVPRLGSSLDPAASGRLVEIPGQVPSLRAPIVGCAFAGRCPDVTDRSPRPARRRRPATSPPATTPNASAPRRSSRDRVAHDKVRRMKTPPLLEANALRKHFPLRGGLFGRSRGVVHAVDGVTFTVDRGETLSVVGESGCGKSTVGRMILRLTDLTDGEVLLDGERIDNLPPRRLRPIRRRVQVVFQDPFSSLNPRMRVRDIIAEPIVNFGIARGRAAVDDRVATMLDTVRLPRDAMRRHAHEFSGGQRQRIGIARALAPGADLLVCDEAVSALDVSVKAQIVNLLADLQRDLGLAMLFISHDLAIVEHMTHRVAVMYLGKIAEIADRRSLFSSPRHPYTRALLSAVPVPDPDARRARIVLRGDVPSPIDPPSGCRFHTRCPCVFDRCRVEEPWLRDVGPTQKVACHLDELPALQ